MLISAAPQSCSTSARRSYTPLCTIARDWPSPNNAAGRSLELAACVRVDGNGLLHVENRDEPGL